jgi:hypothetical protein
MQNEQVIKQEEREAHQLRKKGVEILMAGFGKTVEALFEKIDGTENPFTEMPPTDRTLIIQTALAATLGQSIAAQAIVFSRSTRQMVNDTVPTLVLYADTYYNQFKGDLDRGQQNGVGVRP